MQEFSLGQQLTVSQMCWGIHQRPSGTCLVTGEARLHRIFTEFPPEACHMMSHFDSCPKMIILISPAFPRHVVRPDDSGRRA